MSIEILSDEASRYSIELASAVTSYVYRVPVLCRTYTARITVNNSGVIGSHKEVSIDATPFGVFLIGVSFNIKINQKFSHSSYLNTHHHQVKFLRREFESIGIFERQAFRFLVLSIIELFLLLAISLNPHRVHIVYDICNIFVSSQFRYRSIDFKLFATILISPQIPSAPTRFDLRFPETNF